VRSLQKKMMDYCTYCPKMCRFSCPVSEVTKKETFTPWGKMQVARWLFDKNLPLSPEDILPVYQCTNCLHCQKYCEHNNDVPEALREIRNLAVENYVAPPKVYEVEKNYSKFNNPYGVELPLPRPPVRSKSKSEVLFFPSCHTRKFFPQRITTYFELFEKLKIKNVRLHEDSVPCCGEPLRALGFKNQFEEIAQIQYYNFKKYRYIVTDGPECCVSIGSHYRQTGHSLDDKVLHLLEFLDPYLEHSNYRTQGKVRGRLIYHDPPFLTRHGRSGDLPRKLISHITGFMPLDLSFSDDDSLSSGVEGSYGMIFPDISQKISFRILEEISNRRIKKLITACSQSEEQFRRLAKGIEIQDIYEFLNEQILV